jgi:hypothetical protein
VSNDQILVGLTLKGVKLAKDKQSILFQTDKGDIKVAVDADCCSTTWIESIELPALGFPSKVISVANLDMPDLGDIEGCDVVAYYGCKIVTDGGEIIIDYRNDSNGYYGGNLSWPGDYFYGGVYGQNVSASEWVDISRGKRNRK